MKETPMGSTAIDKRGPAKTLDWQVWHVGRRAIKSDDTPDSQPTLVPGVRMWEAVFTVAGVDERDVDAAVSWFENRVGHVLSHKWDPPDRDEEWHDCPSCICDLTNPPTLLLTVQRYGPDWDTVARDGYRIGLPERVRDLRDVAA